MMMLLLIQRCSLGQGRYIFKLLAIDVPTAEGPEQRVYLSGDDAIYNRGVAVWVWVLEGHVRNCGQ